MTIVSSILISPKQPIIRFGLFCVCLNNCGDKEERRKVFSLCRMPSVRACLSLCPPRLSPACVVVPILILSRGFLPFSMLFRSFFHSFPILFQKTLAIPCPLWYNVTRVRKSPPFRCLSAHNFIRRGIEAVITGLTRNQFVGNHTRVRIPPSPPSRDQLNTQMFNWSFAFINSNPKIFSILSNRIFCLSLLLSYHGSRKSQGK